MTLIYILGIDGSGKTTVARRLAAAGLCGRLTRYLYCQHQPLLLRAPKWAARARFLRGAVPHKDYEAYRARKLAAVCRYPRLARCYARLWCVDAALQAWPKILWARGTADIVVVDRYYLDWVVNIGALARNSVQSMLRQARQFERFLPKAQLHVFLEVEEETSFRRKHDIPSAEYLRERRCRYLQLAPRYDFHVVDANQDLESVFNAVCALADAVANAGRPNTSHSAAYR